jgi:hypothetical protein
VTGRRILIVTHVRQLWSEKQSGTCRAINSMADYLSRQHSVDFYCTKYVIKRPPADIRLHCGQSLPAYLAERLRFYGTRFLFGKNLKRPLLLEEAGELADRECAAFGKYLAGSRYDVVIFEYVLNHHLLGIVNREKTRCLLDTHDIMHIRTQTFAASGKTLALAITESEELACFSQYDRVLAIQEREYDYLERNISGKGLLVKRPAELHKLPLVKEREEKLRLCFLGSAAEHNIDAVNWFLANVWDDELGALLSLEIFGAVCDELDRNSIEGLAGVALRNTVPSVEEAYSTTHLVINPVQIGSGLKIKNIEAIGYCRGVITTPLGVQGMEQCVGRSMMVADDAMEMKRLLLACSSDEQKVRTMSEFASQDAASYFSPEACFRELSEYIASPQ